MFTVDDRRLRPLLAWALGAFLLTTGCKPGWYRKHRDEKREYVVVAQEQQASWIRNFNPLLAPSSVRWPSPAGIYEPLLVFSAVQGQYVPWLATEHHFSADNRKLVFKLRAGVKWSDGTPFTAADVVFTYQLLRKFAALDLHGIWKYLDEVTQTAPDEVTLSFSRVFVPGLFRIAQQPIVPRHIWQDVADPVTFTNPNPVATGPFTEVRTFQNQVYELGRNPNYWQPGKPAVKGLRFPAYPGNDQSSLALLNGDVDWSGKFIPSIERVYVAHDPEHRKYWFPNMGGTHNVYVNTTLAPFDDVRVRKALSHAFNRERIARVAVYGYTKPVGPNGLSQAYTQWAKSEGLDDPTWTSHDVQKANALLDAAGFVRGPDGIRVGPDGKPMRFDFNVVAGWSDWITAVQLMIDDLAQIGVAATMKALAFSAWYDTLQRGKFQLSMGWAEEGPTPYSYYRFVMSGAARKPPGEVALMNWGRFENAEVDAALAAFESTNDLAEQHRLSDQLQSLFSKHAPIIPLHPSPSWGICNTKHFKGFPSADNPYARLSPFNPPEYLLVLVNLEPT